MIQTLMNPLKVEKFICCHSGERGWVTIDKNALRAVFVIPGLTRAHSEALALSSVFSNNSATGCRIKSGMTSRN